MASFFEKLKRGMGAEPQIKDTPPAESKSAIEEIKEAPEPKSESKPKKQRKKKTETKTAVDSSKEQEEIKNQNNIMPEKVENKTNEESSFAKTSKWPSFGKDQEGQLAIDVYQTEEFLVIQSAIAGIKPDSLDIVIEGDMVLIKGCREKPEEKGDRSYFYQECFWGPFSRQIILSLEVDPARAEALLKDGILTIRLPKIERDKKRKLVVKG
jgi:HSP20 family molecular chaperone IbpA